MERVLKDVKLKKNKMKNMINKIINEFLETAIAVLITVIVGGLILVIFFKKLKK